MTNEEIGDRLAIRELVENWALFRDARRWDRFRELWHEDGRMITTCVQGTFEDFIKASQAAYDKGVRFSSLSWRHNHRPQRGPSNSSNQNDDIATCHHRRGALRRGVYRKVLFFH
jgi:hypothetical protein